MGKILYSDLSSIIQIFPRITGIGGFFKRGLRNAFYPPEFRYV